MVEHGPAEEVDARLGLLWFGSTALGADLQRNLVLVDLGSKLVSQLQRKHKIFPVFDGVCTPLECLASFNLDHFVLAERINLRVVSQVNLVVFVFSFFQHLLFCPVVLLIGDECLL